MNKSKNKLLLFREQRGLSWRGFAERMGIARNALKRIAYGRVKDLKLSTIERIENFTGLVPDDYFVRPKKK